MAYSKEFRGQILAACDDGMGTQEVALKFKVVEVQSQRVVGSTREAGSSRAGQAGTGDEA